MKTLMIGLSLIALSSCSTDVTPSEPNPFQQFDHKDNDNVHYAKEAIRLDYMPMDDLSNEGPLIKESTSQMNLPEDGQTEGHVYDEMFVLRDQDDRPVKNFAYKIVTEEGDAYRGYTNERGETIRVTTGNRPVLLCVLMDLDRTDNNLGLIKEKTDTPCPPNPSH